MSNRFNKKEDVDKDFRHRDRVKFAQRGSEKALERRVFNIEEGVTPVPGVEVDPPSGGGDPGGGDPGGGGGGSVRFFEADVTSTDPLVVVESGQSPVSAVNRSGKYLNPGYVVWCSFDSSTGETSVLSVLSAGSGGGDSTVFPPSPVPPKTFNGFPRSELVEGDINGEQKLFLKEKYVLNAVVTTRGVDAFARDGGQLKPTSVGPYASNLWVGNYVYDANDMGTSMKMFSDSISLGFLLENSQIYCATRDGYFDIPSASSTTPVFEYYQESDSTTYSVPFPDNTQTPSWVSNRWTGSYWRANIAVDPVSRRAFMLNHVGLTYNFRSFPEVSGFILWELDLTSASSRQLGWQLVWDWNVQVDPGGTSNTSYYYISVNQNEANSGSYSLASASPAMLLFACATKRNTGDQPDNYRTLPSVGVDLNGTPIIFWENSTETFSGAVMPTTGTDYKGLKFHVTETGFKSQRFNTDGNQKYETSLWNVPDTTYTSNPSFYPYSTNSVSGRAHRRCSDATIGSTIMPWGTGPTLTDLPAGYSADWSLPSDWETDNEEQVVFPATEDGDMYGLRMVWLTSDDDGLRYPFLQYAFKIGNVAWVKMSGDPGGSGAPSYNDYAAWFMDFEGNTVAQAKFPTWYELLVSPPPS